MLLSDVFMLRFLMHRHIVDMTKIECFFLNFVRLTEETRGIADTGVVQLRLGTV